MFNAAVHDLTATITAKTYEVYREPRTGGDGVDVKLLGEVSDPKAYPHYNWVQTVTTNQPLGGNPMDAPYPDAAADNAPYYNSKDNYQKYELAGVLEGGVTVFKDAPSRVYTGTPISWQANLSLVGINADGSYDVLKTVSYGFTRDAAGVHLMPLVGK